MEHQPPPLTEKAVKKRKLSCTSTLPGEEEEQNGEPKLPHSSSPTLNPLLSKVKISDLNWKKIKKENLDLDYVVLFPRPVATALLQALEEQVEYFTGDLARVKVFGKWHNLPRKQV